MSKRALELYVILLSCFVLLGCKENLYSDLPENEVNMMIAVLEENGIPADRKKTDQNKYELMVEVSDFTRAVKILSARGYPRKKFQSLADVFSNEGIVKTPFEQRARFVHALNQEIARSLSDIEGIVSARVHITLPEATRFGKTSEKPRAAVIILHASDKPITGMKPKIKKFVSYSVSGVTYDNVTVVMSAVGNKSSSSAPKSGGSNFEILEARADDRPFKVKADKTSWDKGIQTRSHEPKVRKSSALSFVSWLLFIVAIVLAAVSVWLWQKARKQE